MRVLFPLMAAAIVLSAFTVPAEADEKGFDAFLKELEGASAAEREAIIEMYFSENTFPVTEGSSAWFVYLDENAQKVSVAGDFNGWNRDSDIMEKFPGTGLFYLHREFEPDARLDYKFVVNGSVWILDPANPARVAGGFGPNSELAMPQYLQPMEIVPDPDIDHGEVITHSFPSKITRSSRRILVYLPHGYGGGDKVYPVLFVNDGREYVSLGSMVHTADNMIAAGSIEPLIMILVDPVERNSEYKAGEEFTKMVVTEVIPWVEENYRVEKRPARRGMMGASLGGLISVHITWNHPDQFGFCASQSGAFHRRYTNVIEMVKAGPPREIRFYLDWGSYEKEIAESNELMKEALLSGGHELQWQVFPEGHSWGSWRAHTDDILRAFVGNKEKEEDR